MTDVAAGVTYYYTSDLIGRPTVMRSNHGQSLQVSYDEKNRTDAVISDVKGVTTETGFTYGDGSSMRPEAAITGVTVDGQPAVDYFYDSLGRLKYKYVGLGNAGTDIVYTYKNGTSEGQTSTLVSSVSDNNVTTSYTYDSLGNITGITASGYTGTKRRSYEYDALGQLVRDNDGIQGRTTTYTYDAGGNITTKKIYAYTTGELGEVLDTITYGYNDASWKDMMTSYDGQTITYDAIGNPLTYRDGMSFSWIRGRRLGSLTVGDTTASYTYDDGGIRTSKTVNGVKTTYYLNGSAILAQICGDTRLDFFYDEQGSVIGFKYNNGIYLYKKNIQGDIIGIINSAETVIAEYSYDAWGKLLSITGTEAQGIGTLNPFRYRGYYYDNESGLYYLNSRYYDAETGRFVNADVTAALTLDTGLFYKNLYLYCDNNPVTRLDTDGAYWDTVFDVISLAVSIVDVVNNPSDPWAWVALVADVVCIALPVAAGGGFAVKALTKADDVVDAVKAVDKVDEAVKMTESTIETMQTAAKTLNSGSNSVYVSYVDDVIEYVGITNDFERRKKEWEGIRKIVEIIPNLDRNSARFIEQAVIDTCKTKKNGGYLSNIINSIGKRNPIYKDYLEFLKKFNN